jgi:hypothetical protein
MKKTLRKLATVLGLLGVVQVVLASGYAQKCDYITTLVSNGTSCINCVSHTCGQYWDVYSCHWGVSYYCSTSCSFAVPGRSAQCYYDDCTGKCL